MAIWLKATYLNAFETTVLISNRLTESDKNLYL